MFINAKGNQLETLNVVDALIENFPDMIHSVDEEGNIVYVNRTASALLGYTEQELGAMNIRQLYPPEILGAVEQGFREVKQSGAKTVESLFIAKDGTRIPVELRTIVIHDEQGGFARTFTVSRDMRQLKEMQEHLIHAGRLAAIGELAAGVVHDLNNPLTAIILSSTVISKTLEGSNVNAKDIREQLVAYCETVNESAAVMENLTTRLRDFSRGVKEQHVPVDLFVPVNDALFIMAHRIRNHNIKVVCPVVKGRHWIRGDRNQIQQIFLNLFSNACDAMANGPERGLSIKIEAETLDGVTYWNCAVSDTGEGVPPELQEKIFKSFFTTKPRGKGTGLGLSITRAILSEHNGQIRLASEPGNGSTFSLLFPQMEVARLD
ncbi:MAG: ATP-binding protein [Kiritimatiellae bacterium]|nr:ATP-binding protein [Kiritimatiellia bacterium]